MAQKILVTGNGFDLYHGLKTNFSDFVKCVEDAFGKRKEERTPFQVKMTELCNVNGFFRHFHFILAESDTWSYFEQEMGNILQALIYFQETILECQKDPEYDLISYNMVGGQYTYNDLQVYKHFARIFEQIYDDPSGGMFKIRQQYITPEKLLNKKAVVDEVRRELQSFTEALNLYLSEQVMKSEIRTRSSQVEAISPDYVINFNYTDTVRYYAVSENQIFYAKGKAGLEENHLVLGVPDESEDHMDWVYLKNYFQKLMKFVGLPDKKQLYPLDEAGRAVSVETHYFGYSFPEGDKELIEELFAASVKNVIYYYDREDYAYKMIQLLKLFGKNQINEKIQSGEIIFEIVK